MASPIPLTFPARDVREELHAKLQDAPTEHAEALLAALQVLQGLHDRGVLETMRGALGAGDKILETLVEDAKAPEAVRGLINLIVLAKAFGSVDPVLLNGFARALPDALHQMATPDAKPPGYFAMLLHFRSPDLRRGVLFVNRVLEAFGRNLRRPGQA